MFPVMQCIRIPKLWSGHSFLFIWIRPKKLESIESEAPSPLDVPTGCPFQNRCEHCMERCKKEMPELKEVAPGHEAACFYVEKAKNRQGGSK